MFGLIIKNHKLVLITTKHMTLVFIYFIFTRFPYINIAPSSPNPKAGNSQWKKPSWFHESWLVKETFKYRNTNIFLIEESILRIPSIVISLLWMNITFSVSLSQSNSFSCLIKLCSREQLKMVPAGCWCCTVQISSLLSGKMKTENWH